MTCKEKLSLEHPECISPNEYGGCVGCPHEYGYMGVPDYCAEGRNDIGQCDDCWNREISGETVCEKHPDEEDITLVALRESLKHAPVQIIDKNAEPHIKDSGDRTEFASGAVRDMRVGKGRCDLLPLDVMADIYAYYYCGDNTREANAIFNAICKFQDTGNMQYLYQAVSEFELYDTWSDLFLEVAKHFEEGAKKYGDNNWRKGIPVRCYVDSGVRHYLKYLRGDTDEPHDRAFCWNILCAIWTCKHKPELNEYAREDVAIEKGSN